MQWVGRIKVMHIICCKTNTFIISQWFFTGILCFSYTFWWDEMDEYTGDLEKYLAVTWKSPHPLCIEYSDLCVGQYQRLLDCFLQHSKENTNRAGAHSLNGKKFQRNFLSRLLLIFLSFCFKPLLFLNCRMSSFLVLNLVCPFLWRRKLFLKKDFLVLRESKHMLLPILFLN